MANNNDLRWSLGLDTEPLAQGRRAANKEIRALGDDVKRTIKQAGNEAEREAGRISGAFASMAKSAAGFFTLSQAVSFTRKIVEIRGEIERLETSFSTLLGSRGASASLMSELRDFAVNTPMMLGSLAKGAQTMLGFGIEAEKLMPLLKALGDISMGDDQKFQSLTLAFSQMSATGKLMGQDLLQMINAGFNPLMQISERTGKSIGQLKDEMSKGAISVEMVTQAIVDATSEGGKFNGMLASMAQTSSGAISNAKGAIDEMANSIGERLQPYVIEAANAVYDLAKNYEEVGRSIAELVALYGTYRAALIVLNATQKAAAMASAGYTAAEIANYNALLLAEKAQKLLNATILKNPYMIAAAAVAALVAGMYKLITAQTRAEKLQERQADLSAEREKELARENAALDIYFNRLRNAEKGTEEYAKAKKAIQDKYGEYLSGMNAEITALDNATLSQQALAAAIRDTADARLYEQQISDASARRAETESANLSSIVKRLRKDLGESAGDALFGELRDALKGAGDYDTKYAEAMKILRENLSQQQMTAGAWRGKGYAADVARYLWASKDFEDEKKLAETLYGKPSGEGSVAETGKKTTATIKETNAEIEKALKDFYARIEKARTDAEKATLEGMAEGQEKELALIEFNLREQLKAIDQEQKELIEAKKKAGLGSGLSNEEADAFKTRAEAAEKAAAKSSKDVLKRYADELESFYKDLSEASDAIYLNATEQRLKDLEKAFTDRQDQLERLLREGGISEEEYFKASAANMEVYAAAVTDEISDIEGAAEDAGKALSDAAEAAEKRFNDLLDTLDAVADTLGNIGGEIGGELGEAFSSIGSAIGSITRLQDSLKQYQGADGSLSMAGYATAGGAAISGIVGIVSMIGESIKANRAAQLEWNAAIKDADYNLLLAQLDEMDYKQRNMFGVENPYQRAIDGAKQYAAAISDLAKQGNALAGGSVQTGTKKVVDWANVGKGAGLGATAGAAIGSVIPVIGTAIGAAIGAVVGTVGGALSTKTVAVFEKLKSKYGQIYDPETFELNKKLVADYDLLDDATKKIVDGWQQIKEKAKQAKEEMEETISGLAGDLGSQLQDSLIEAWTGGDVRAAIDDYKGYALKQISSIVEGEIFSNIFGGLFDELGDRMKGSFGNGGDQSITDDIEWLLTQYPAMLETWSSAMDSAKSSFASKGFDLWSNEEERRGLSKSALGASQDSIDESNARLTTIQGHTYTIQSAVLELQSSAAAALNHLAGIEDNTKDSAEELGRIKRTLDDMNTRGVMIRG